MKLALYQLLQLLVICSLGGLLAQDLWASPTTDAEPIASSTTKQGARLEDEKAPPSQEIPTQEEEQLQLEEREDSDEQLLLLPTSSVPSQVRDNTNQVQTRNGRHAPAPPGANHRHGPTSLRFAPALPARGPPRS